MSKSKSHKKKRQPKRVLALPDLEQAKAEVLNSLTSASGQRTYDHAISELVAWYCSEPRLAFNRTVVLRYRIHLEQRQYAPATINLRLAAVRHDGRRTGRRGPSRVVVGMDSTAGDAWHVGQAIDAALPDFPALDPVPDMGPWLCC